MLTAVFCIANVFGIPADSDCEILVRRISVRGVVVVALIAHALGGMAIPPPYANPLTPDQVNRLTISEVHFAKFAGDVDAKFVSRVEDLIKSRMLERFGEKFVPGKGNSDVIVTIRTLQVDGPVEQPRRVEIALSARNDRPTRVFRILLHR
jgi:hypothetical protein